MNASAQGPASAPPEPPKATSVVLADPDPEARKHIAELLRAAHREAFGEDGELELREADTGTAAWELIESSAPALVVCEILLEGLNGLQLLRRLRSTQSGDGPGVFLVTHMSQEVDRYWALRNGATAFVVKPFEDEFLRARVLRFLRRDDHSAESPWPDAF